MFVKHECNYAVETFGQGTDSNIAGTQCQISHSRLRNAKRDRRLTEVREAKIMLKHSGGDFLQCPAVQEGRSISKINTNGFAAGYAEFRRPMKGIVVALIASIISAGAFASCPVADTLIAEFGITFSGFDKPIPKADSDPKHNTRPEDWLYMALSNPRGHVSDGFTHAAVMDRVRRLAWIHRTGGFVGVNEWYGPVELKKGISLQCDFAQAGITPSSTPTPKNPGQHSR